MTIKTINASQIREISPKGITYTEEDDSEGFIDFEVCYQNYLNRRLSEENLKYVQQINNIPDEKMPTHIERIKSWKEVGRRNVSGNKNGHIEEDPKSGNPYFVFYQEPPIAVECEGHNEYWMVRHGYEQHGWRTGDMT